MSGRSDVHKVFQSQRWPHTFTASDGCFAFSVSPLWRSQSASASSWLTFSLCTCNWPWRIRIKHPAFPRSNSCHRQGRENLVRSLRFWSLADDSLLLCCEYYYEWILLYLWGRNVSDVRAAVGTWRWNSWHSASEFITFNSLSSCNCNPEYHSDDLQSPGLFALVICLAHLCTLQWRHSYSYFYYTIQLCYVDFWIYICAESLSVILKVSNPNPFFIWDNNPFSISGLFGWSFGPHCINYPMTHSFMPVWIYVVTILTLVVGGKKTHLIYAASPLGWESENLPQIEAKRHQQRWRFRPNASSDHRAAEGPWSPASLLLIMSHHVTTSLHNPLRFSRRCALKQTLRNSV